MMSWNKFLSVSRLAYSVGVPAISNASVYLWSGKTVGMARFWMRPISSDRYLGKV